MIHDIRNLLTILELATLTEQAMNARMSTDEYAAMLIREGLIRHNQEAKLDEMEEARRQMIAQDMDRR